MDLQTLLLNKKLLNGCVLLRGDLEEPHLGLMQVLVESGVFLYNSLVALSLSPLALSQLVFVETLRGFLVPVNKVGQLGFDVFLSRFIHFILNEL